MTEGTETGAGPASSAMRAVIVEDEPLGRKRVLDLLARRNDVEVVAIAASGREAVDAILAHDPDLVLLDVQLPDFSGIEVVRSVGVSNMPPTIFITAYERHALKAFELAAIDYLLKPFDDERFAAALARARDAALLRQIGDVRLALEKLLDISPEEPGVQSAAAKRSDRRYLERIAVEVRGQQRFIPVSQIEYITADGPYAQVHAAGARHVLRERMSTLEEQLDPAVFIRIHRSIIVRLEYIDAFHTSAGGDYSVQLRDGVRLKVARGRRDELVERLRGGGVGDRKDLR